MTWGFKPDTLGKRKPLASNHDSCFRNLQHPFNGAIIRDHLTYARNNRALHETKSIDVTL